jgi:hypothetical protein
VSVCLRQRTARTGASSGVKYCVRKISLDLPWDVEMRSRFCLFTLLVGSALFHPAALASCPVPDTKVNGEFFNSDAVFTGTVLSQRYRELDKDHSGWFYRVAHVFNGPMQKRVHRV